MIIHIEDSESSRSDRNLLYDDTSSENTISKESLSSPPSPQSLSKHSSIAEKEKEASKRIVKQIGDKTIVTRQIKATTVVGSGVKEIKFENTGPPIEQQSVQQVTKKVEEKKQEVIRYVSIEYNQN